MFDMGIMVYKQTRFTKESLAIRFNAIQNRNALWEGIRGSFYAVSTARARNAYFCVGSTAPSLDIFLFAINLMQCSKF